MASQVLGLGPVLEKGQVMRWHGPLYHCIMRLFAFHRPRWPVRRTPSTRMSIIKCLPSQIFALARAHTRPDPEFPRVLRPGPSWCQEMGDGKLTGDIGHKYGNMVSTTCTTQPKSGLCVYTNPWWGNGHIWIWSLKTDRHLALWIVVISLKCDNTKRSDVTSLKAWTDAGHAPGPGDVMFVMCPCRRVIDSDSLSHISPPNETENTISST